MNQFGCKTKLYCGEGALSMLGKAGIRRLFVVTDPFFLKNGTAQKIADLTGADHSVIFGEVRPDPGVAEIAAAVAALQKSDADTVLAIGGGSAMDCAKAALYFAERSCRLIAVPTTSGSGSEVTNFAVITVGKTKYPLVDDALQPDVAILDSDLLRALPPSLIADSGYDAVCHAVEGFVATGHTPMSDALASGALMLALQNLPKSHAGDLNARMEMHCASAMAALAFSQAGLGACHALSHSLGGLFHVPHGRLNGVLLPVVLSMNSRENPGRYAALARQAGIPGGSDFMAVRNLKTALTRLRRELSLPETLSQAGISPAQVRQNLDAILQAAMADTCSGTNPVPVSEAYLRLVLREAAGV